MKHIYKWQPNQGKVPIVGKCSLDPSLNCFLVLHSNNGDISSPLEEQQHINHVEEYDHNLVVDQPSSFIKWGNSLTMVRLIQIVTIVRRISIIVPFEHQNDKDSNCKVSSSNQSCIYDGHPLSDISNVMVVKLVKPLGFRLHTLIEHALLK